MTATPTPPVCSRAALAPAVAAHTRRARQDHILRGLVRRGRGRGRGRAHTPRAPTLRVRTLRAPTHPILALLAVAVAAVTAAEDLEAEASAEVDREASLVVHRVAAAGRLVQGGVADVAAPARHPTRPDHDRIRGHDRGRTRGRPHVQDRTHGPCRVPALARDPSTRHETVATDPPRARSDRTQMPKTASRDRDHYLAEDATLSRPNLARRRPEIDARQRRHAAANLSVDALCCAPDQSERPTFGKWIKFYSEPVYKQA
ncbi:hypothetical protein L1887_54082 [Cichorium endivia]|nr:hypothetical protein L1887_54082 [Cichorium endivia]